jgi:DNA (cytosine-5)-methyltransferase 1
MNHASLFSGIGGFDLAAEWNGWNNVFNCEWEEFPRKVLKHHFPNAKQYEDIKDFNATEYRGRVDVLSGGFPCQPFSTAGLRKGTEDERHLWPEMLRVVGECQPRWVVGENVRGLVSWSDGLVLEACYSDLENLGYSVQSFIIPACATGAPHRRDRVWIVAYAPDTNCIRGGQDVRRADRESNEYNEIGQNGNAPDTERIRLEHRENQREMGGRQKEVRGKRGEPTYEPKTRSEIDEWETFPTVPPICGGDDGLPQELDGITFSKWRRESIKAYGNAIVPQVAHRIFQSISDYESST